MGDKGEREERGDRACRFMCMSLNLNEKMMHYVYSRRIN